MLPLIVVLTAAVPAFAPAPVWTPARPTYRVGDLGLVRDSEDERSVTLSMDGKETVYQVARGAKVTINGHKGYSFDDVGYGCSAKNRVVLTIKDGVAVALDVTFPLREGEKLWRPGMSDCQVAMRKAMALQRLGEELRRPANAARALPGRKTD